MLKEKTMYTHQDVREVRVILGKNIFIMLTNSNITLHFKIELFKKFHLNYIMGHREYNLIILM